MDRRVRVGLGKTARRRLCWPHPAVRSVGKGFPSSRRCSIASARSHLAVPASLAGTSSRQSVCRARARAPAIRRPDRRFAAFPGIYQWLSISGRFDRL